MKHRVINFILLGLLLAPLAGAGQIRARVAGLEKNSEYMALLLKEHQLQTKVDSLSKVIEITRAKFRDEPENRTRYRDDILRLESEIFDVRNEIGITANRIGNIEQEYVISNLGKQTATPEPPKDTVSSPVRMVANLTGNDYFREHLAPADYATLLAAQTREPEVVNYLKTYRSNYRTIADIARRYVLVDNETVADSLYHKYQTLTGLNERIADTVASIWGYIYDNKTYIYSYLLDKMNHSDLLSQFEEKTIKSRDRIAALQNQGMSEVPAAYAVHKQLTLDYEKTLAGLLKLETAADSLRKAEAALAEEEYELPLTSIERRYFYDYADIDQFSPAKYNAKNPIPPTKVFPKGTVYRILLGTYQKAQLPSIFRGVYPLSYTESEEGGYSYYAGGYASVEEAEKGVALLKRLGFRKPRLVVWENGSFTNLSEEQTAGASDQETVLYRVEITGAGEDLSDSVKEVIRTYAEGKEISRVNELFVVGSFESEAEANQLAEAIRATAPDIQVKIAEIAL